MVRVTLALGLLLSATTLLRAQDGDPYGDPGHATGAYFRGYWGPVDPYIDVMDAQGRWLINKQKARLLHEEAKQKALQTRRKELEHWHWEQMFIPRAREEQRRLQREILTRRAVNDPPADEIYGAFTLNWLLTELERHPDKLDAAKSTTLTQEAVLHLHARALSDVGNAGLLSGDKLPWPGALLVREDLQSERDHIDELIRKCKAARIRNQNPAAELDELRDRVERLNEQIHREFRQGSRLWNERKQVYTLHFIRDLRAGLDLLERPDAGICLKPIEGRNVAEVVAYMRAKGLTFAPAVNGDERFYFSTYKSFRDELERIEGVPVTVPLLKSE